MTTLPIPKTTVAGFTLAAVAIALGVGFGTKLAGEEAGLFVLHCFYALAAAAVFKAVFLWGEARGFPIRSISGRILFANLLRNLGMVVIAIPVILLLTAPLALLAFQLAR